MIISVKLPGESSSSFVNLSDLFGSNDLERISTCYRSFVNSVHGYEISHLESITRANEAFYSRAQEITYKPTQMGRILSIVTLGLFHLKKRYDLRVFKAHMEALHIRGKRQISFLSNLPENSPLSTIDKIRANWIKDPKKELARLQAIPRVARSLSKFSGARATAIAYGHTIELQDKLKDTHIVVNTGTSGDIALLNTLVTAIKKVVEKRVQSGFAHMRHQQFFPKEERAPDFYKRRITATAARKGESDHDYSAELISADLFLESNIEAESALSFFTGGHPNIQAALNPNFTQSLIRKVTRYYFGSQIAEKIEEKLLEIVPSNTLYSICIPKENFTEVAYLSHRFGIAYREGFFTEREIRNMQSGEDNPFAENPPQVRVLPHKLDPNKDVYVVPSSPTPIDSKWIEQIIKRSIHGF